MAGNQTLTLWTKLLVAEYGRNRVIAALAQADGAEIEAIEREVDAYKRRQVENKPRRRPKTLAELLEPLKLDTDAHALVKAIGAAYQNKRYLGELWRVKRFLESHGVDAAKLRSRTAALPVLVGVLGDLPVTELSEIAAESNGSARGDLGIIADQILGSDPSTSSRGETGAPSDKSPSKGNAASLN